MTDEPELRRQESERLIAEMTPHTYGIMILPLYRLDDGVGVYDERSIDLVRDLRANGISAEWASEPDARSYSTKRSADEIIFTVSLAIAPA